MIRKITLTALVLASGIAVFLGLRMNNEEVGKTYIPEEDILKNDNPMGFAEYHAGIRTAVGKNRPDYTPGHEYMELQKALKRSAAMRSEDEWPWVERGPGNVGGRTRTILVSEKDETKQTWFAGTASGGVWRTTDAGASWESVTPNLPNLASVCIAQAKSNPDVLYVGTGEGAYYFSVGAIGGMGIFKSTDHGETWELLESTRNSPDFLNTSRIIVDPNDENILLAATANGVFDDFGRLSETAIMRSEDGGISWERVSTPPGFPLQLLADPEDFNIQYCGMFLQGMMKSTDGGRSWRVTNLGSVAESQGSGNSSLGRTEIAIAPSNPDRLYASVQLQPSSSALLMSEDKGENWVAVENSTGTNPTSDYLGQGWFDNCITVDPRNENKVFWGGVDLWSALIVPGAQRLGPREFLGVTAQNADFMDFVNFTPAVQPPNSELIWGNRILITDPSLAVSTEVRFGPGVGQKAHRFLACGGNFGAGCLPDDYEYQDYVDVPFEVWDIENNQQLMISFRDQQDDGAYDLNPRNEGDVDLLTSREYIFIHRTPYEEAPSPNIARDGGQTYQIMYDFWPFLAQDREWTPESLETGVIQIRYGNLTYQSAGINNVTDGYGRHGGTNSIASVHVDHHYLTMYETETGARLISTNDGGVAYSDNDGDTWTEVDRNSNLNSSQFYGVARHPDSKIYIGGTQDNSTVISQGASPGAPSPYRTVIGGDGFEALWNSADPSQVIGTAQNNSIFRSTDGGSRWVRAVSGMRDVGANAPFISRLENSHKRPETIFAVGRSGVWKSTNFGGRWSSSPISDARWAYDNAGRNPDIEVSDANPDIVWTGCGMFEGASIFVSQDGGDNFSATRNFVDREIGRLTGLATHPTEPNTAYAIFSQAKSPKILRTNDLGNTWEDISGFGTGEVSTNGFPDVAVFDLLVLPGDSLLAGTSIGIFLSPDNGESWAFADNGLPAVAIWQLEVMPNDGELIVATHGRGIWSAALNIQYEEPETGGDDDTSGDDDPVTGLFDNNESLSLDIYPNPASNRVRFELPEGNSFAVRLFNLKGQMLRSFETKGGLQNMDVSGFSPGTYILRASDGAKTYASKLVIER